MEQNIVLEMRGINKNFPGVKALQDVDFTLRKGEIHALMGENGAGKSTLIKVLTGVEEFETGTIRMEGSSNTIINRSPQEAQENGISTVYQEVNLCPNLSVAENDNMAFGAIDAIKAAGKTCGPDGDIIIFSFDAVKAAFDAMIAGDLNAAFECNPLHGPRVDEIIKKLEKGETVEKIQYVDEAYFDTSMDLESIKAERAY